MEYSSKWGMDPSLRDKGPGLVALVLPHVPAEHRLLPHEAANPGHAEAAVRAEHGSGTVIHCVSKLCLPPSLLCLRLGLWIQPCARLGTCAI